MKDDECALMIAIIKNVINIINNVYCGAKCVSLLGLNILNILCDKSDETL